MASAGIAETSRADSGERFESRGFAFAPLQTSWVARENNLQPDGRPSEMRVRTVAGGDFGGVNAVLFLAQFVWWGGPLRLFARIPGGQTLLNRIYREIAARRSWDGGACLLRQPSE